MHKVKIKIELNLIFLLTFLLILKCSNCNNQNNKISKSSNINANHNSNSKLTNPILSEIDNNDNDHFTYIQQKSTNNPSQNHLHPHHSNSQPSHHIKKETSYNNNDLISCVYNQADIDCKDLDAECIECFIIKENIKETKNCIYGRNVNVTCQPKSGVVCKGPNERFQREIKCMYCYQTPLYHQSCHGVHSCTSINLPREFTPVNCTVNKEVICLGNRRFTRNMPCNWVNGYRWSTTLLLSVTLGGFGADRFYLGRWQEGIGKLFSFGGLGIWTLIDIVLIAVRYLGPMDGSLYVD